jgi:VWFA-related protein
MVPATSNKPHPERSSSSNTLANARLSPRLLLTLFRLSVLAGAGALCWAAAPRLVAQEPPVFHARTELVRMDISVTDQAGQPVDDLRPDEIAITENGRRCPVVLFRHLTNTRGDTDQPVRTFEEVSANEMSPSGHLYVLVFDQLHIAAGHEQRARLAAERFLSRELKPGDAIAVYGLPGPGPAVSFTTDLIHARDQLRQVHGKAGRMTGGLSEFEAYRMTRSGGGANDFMAMSRPSEMTSESGLAARALARTASGEVTPEQASQVVAQADTEGQIFLSRLADIMGRLRWIEGRKAFILFSEGFFADNLASRLEQVAASAAQSNSMIYSVDLNTAQVAGASAGMSATERSQRRDPLATLASETNGRLITNTSNLDTVLSQIAAETTDYYLVGFEPSASDGPHDYHRVKVNVTRHGLVARARTGYSTAPPPTPLADRQAIDVALDVPPTSSALPIEYTTYERIGPTAEKPRIIASVTAHLPCAHAADQPADIVFVVRDAVTGQAMASGTDKVRLPAGANDAPGSLDAVQYVVQFDVPPGEYWMRMLVREPGGVIGTADRRFHVWPLEGAAMSTSDLIVSRLEGTRFDPPTNACVHHDDDVLAYLEVYGTGTAIQPSDARVEILRGGSEEVVATAEPIVKTGSHGERIVRALLPVAGLAEGLYAARVRIAVPHGPARVVMRTFKVVAGLARPPAQR